MKYSKSTICLIVAVVIAFFPFNVNLINGIHIERNEACAVTPIADAVGFIEEAAQSTTLTSAEYVATLTGIVASSGFNISATSAVTMGNTLSQNLAAIKPTTDYPAWSSLSSSEQSNWVSEDNYNAARFNSLMGVVGLDGAYDSYNQSGGNYNFTSGEQDILSSISSIGEDWKAGVGMQYSYLRDLLSSDYIEVISNYYGTNDYKTFDGSNIAGYPSTCAQSIVVNKGNQCKMKFIDGNSTDTNTTTTSANVYWIIGLTNSTWPGYTHIAFSKELFYGSNYGNQAPNNAATSYSHPLGNYYVYSRQSNAPYRIPSIECNMQYNMSTSNDWDNLYRNAIPYILYSGQVDDVGQESTNLVSFPGVTNIDNSTVIYYPPSGINEDTPWDNLLSYQEEITEDLSGVIGLLRHIDSDLHKFQYYATGELKVHDLGVFTELSDIYSLLLEISARIIPNDIVDAPDIIGDFDFDDISDKIPDLMEVIEEVAPFGFMLLLSEIYTILSSQTSIQDPELEVPFLFGGLDNNASVTIDLSWLDGIKPVINFFCILILVIALTNATIRLVELEAAS